VVLPQVEVEAALRRLPEIYPQDRLEKLNAGAGHRTSFRAAVGAVSATVRVDEVAGAIKPHRVFMNLV
jgi:hypothetical protein